MNYIKDLRVNCGGTTTCTGYMEVFKRNKRDIKKTINVFYNGCLTPFQLKDAFGYNKALIYTEKNNPDHEILVSYNTIVLERINDNIKINGWYSRTTSEHINAYLRSRCLPSMNKKELTTPGVKEVNLVTIEI